MNEHLANRIGAHRTKHRPDSERREFSFRSLHGLPKAYIPHHDAYSEEVVKNRHRSFGGFGSHTPRSNWKKDRTLRPIRARQSLHDLLRAPHSAPGIPAMRTPS